ncbi:GNAT family N-acetyltransferase [Streptococcus dentiloxodontae]
MIIKQTRDTLSQTYLDAVSIRNQVFVIGQGVPHSIEVDSDEAHCIHFVLYDDNGKAAATCRLLPNSDQTTVTLQRMAVLGDYQGQGLGRKVLQAAEDFAKEQGFQKISLHAQISAYNFYTRNNYQKIGEVFEEAGIQHITVEKYLKND